MRLLWLLASAVLLAGCAGQSAVQNTTNHFSYAGQAAGENDTETYTWSNTVGSASVQWGGQVAKGSMTLTIQDSVGKEVFKRSLSGQSQEGFSGSTSAGTPGDWKIHINFNSFTGQMGLNINAGASGGGGSWGQGWT